MTRSAILSVTALLLAIVLSACNSTQAPTETQRPMPLLLISIDGFRHDYFDLADIPAIQSLDRKSVV